MTPDSSSRARMGRSEPGGRGHVFGAALGGREIVGVLGLGWIAAAAIAEEPTAAGAAEPAAGPPPGIAVELNRAESVQGGCRLSFVIENRTSHAFGSLQWDLFFFDSQGLILGRMAAEAAPLRAGKTSVKLFDVPDMDCKGLGRVLINDILRCDAGSSGGTEIDCLALTVPSSRASIELIK